LFVILFIWSLYPYIHTECAQVSEFFVQGD